MNHDLRRISGLAVLIAGIALGAWVAFGTPHQWHGAKVLGRMALGLGALTMITGSSRLIFPGPGASEGGSRGRM